MPCRCSRALQPSGPITVSHAYPNRKQLGLPLGKWDQMRGSPPNWLGQGGQASRVRARVMAVHMDSNRNCTHVKGYSYRISIVRGSTGAVTVHPCDSASVLGAVRIRASRDAGTECCTACCSGQRAVLIRVSSRTCIPTPMHYQKHYQTILACYPHLRLDLP